MFINRLAKLLFISTIGIYIFNMLFVWMNAHADSYFYWMISEYFRSGKYPFTSPFIYTKPTTISPPLYGIFFILTHSLPHADVLLHALQLGLLGLSSYLLYWILLLHVKKPIAQIISCFFAIFPINLIYATYVLTENPAQFFVTIWIFFVVLGLVKKRPFFISVAVFIGAVAGLMKYNLMIYMILAGIFLFTYMKKIKIFDLLFPVLAGFIFIGWIFINHTITGVWGLYDTKGTQLYNQFVAQTKIIPPENDPSVIRMRSLLPIGTDIRVPYWDIQNFLIQSLGGVWIDIDKVLFDVAWASVAGHPKEYIGNSLVNFARMHYDGYPHWTNLNSMGRTDKDGNDAVYCSWLSRVKMCDPILQTQWSYPMWNTFITLEVSAFRFFAPFVFYLLFLPSLIFSIFSRDRLLRVYGVMYLVGVVPIAMTIHVDPRYIVPFYPLVMLIVVLSMKRFIEFMVRYKKLFYDVK